MADVASNTSACLGPSQLTHLGGIASRLDSILLLAPPADAGPIRFQYQAPFQTVRMQKKVGAAMSQAPKSIPCFNVENDVLLFYGSLAGCINRSYQSGVYADVGLLDRHLEIVWKRMRDAQLSNAKCFYATQSDQQNADLISKLECASRDGRIWLVTGPQTQEARENIATFLLEVRKARQSAHLPVYDVEIRTYSPASGAPNGRWQQQTLRPTVKFRWSIDCAIDTSKWPTHIRAGGRWKATLKRLQEGRPSSHSQDRAPSIMALPALGGLHLAR